MYVVFINCRHLQYVVDLLYTYKRVSSMIKKMRLKFDKSKNFAIIVSKITRDYDKKKTKEREKI